MRNKKQRGNPPGLPRISNVEVSQKNLHLRVVLLAMAIVIAIVAFWYGFTKLFSIELGWREVEVSSGNLNCSADFLLYYNFVEDSGVSVTAQNKQLTTLYSKATEDAYQLFNNEYASDELHNIRYVNDHINQEITVDPALYKALSAIVEAENRSIYLAPAYAEYLRLFVCGNDVDAVQFDPQKQEDIRTYISEIARFANDPTMIDIQLLGEQRIRLLVAQEYLDFVNENEIRYVLDFSWMTNAFIADYIADLLIENGFTNGYLSSFDGFTRNLCDSGSDFSLNVFQRVKNDILLPATMSYPGGNSIVVLRDFPQDDRDRWHYYAFSNGRIASILLDPADGAEKSAVTSMISYSKYASCAEILMSVAPLYLADALDTQLLNSLTDKGIYSVYAEGTTVYSNDESLKLSLYNDYTRASIK